MNPGTTVVCGDSHTSTHGALGALAFGIGTSEVARVLAAQCLFLYRLKTLKVIIDGSCGPGVEAKDLALAVIAALGASGARGYVIEFCGNAVSDLDVSGRQTLCNMAIEAGARSGLVGYDQTTRDWLRAIGAATPEREERWNLWVSDEAAIFDREWRLDAGAVAPRISWGTSPDQSVDLDQECLPRGIDAVGQRSLDYMGLEPGQELRTITIQRAFLGAIPFNKS